MYLSNSSTLKFFVDFKQKDILQTKRKKCMNSGNRNWGVPKVVGIVQCPNVKNF